MLNKIINDSNVYYIYEIDNNIYGIQCKHKRYLAVVGDNFDYQNFQNGTYNDDDITIETHHISDWFDMVTSGNIITWICACVNRKFIIKEHVKLLLSANPLQLRKDFDITRREFFDSAKAISKQDGLLTAQKYLWQIVKFAVIVNQIIEHHKIINFKIIGEYYRKIVDGQLTTWNDALNVYFSIINPEIERLKQHTDGLLLNDKVKKVVQS